MDNFIIELEYSERMEVAVQAETEQEAREKVERYRSPDRVLERDITRFKIVNIKGLK